MSFVVVRKNEPLESALRRFKKLCERDGILQELKRREYYEKPSAIKHRKKLEQKRKNVKIKEKIKELDLKFDKVFDQD